MHGHISMTKHLLSRKRRITKPFMWLLSFPQSQVIRFRASAGKALNPSLYRSLGSAAWKSALCRPRALCVQAPHGKSPALYTDSVHTVTPSTHTDMKHTRALPMHTKCAAICSQQIARACDSLPAGPLSPQGRAAALQTLQPLSTSAATGLCSLRHRAGDKCLLSPPEQWLRSSLELHAGTVPGTHVCTPACVPSPTPPCPTVPPGPSWT